MRTLLCSLLIGLLACTDPLTAVRGTTTRVAKPEVEKGTELELQIFTTERDCVGAQVNKDDLHLCLPHVDRAHGEVRLGFRYRLSEQPYSMPEAQDHIQVMHQGTLIQNGRDGQAFRIIGHDPEPVRRLYVLVIDGSSSMAENNRMGRVREALLQPAVKDAFFPESVDSAVVLLQFTSGNPVPVGGKLTVLRDRPAYSAAVKSLEVKQGFTHLYDAVAWSTTTLLDDPEINKLIDQLELGVTVVALTDGFNNQKSDDTCGTNAERLGRLLQSLDDLRNEKGTDIRKRPTLFTVGLGKKLRPAFKVPSGRANDVKPVELCGRRYVNERIDGGLETRGIDNASLAWIADKGGGFSYVGQSREDLAAAFVAAAPKRFRWFELRYKTDPFYLRRSFRAGLRLTSFATAEASVMIHPSAWLDAPPGRLGEDGWTTPRSYVHTAVVVMPILGLLVTMGHLGAAGFNIRRALVTRARKPTKAPPPFSGPPPAG
jgi:hypothetical protein